MEEGEGEGLESATIIDEVYDKKKANIPDAPPLIGPKPPGGDMIQVTPLEKEPSLDKYASSTPVATQE
mgnify:CR=1 FL=1